jgi:hypothetical protein
MSMSKMPKMNAARPMTAPATPATRRRPAEPFAVDHEVPERGENEKPDLRGHEDRLADRARGDDHRRRGAQAGHGNQQRERDERAVLVG